MEEDSLAKEDLEEDPLEEEDHLEEALLAQMVYTINMEDRDLIFPKATETFREQCQTQLTILESDKWEETIILKES